MITRSAINGLHVAQVNRARRLIEDAAAEFIQVQLEEAAATLEQDGIAKGAAIFQPRQWDDALKEAIGPAIARSMALGAAAELGLRLHPSVAKSTATDFLSPLGIDLEGVATELPEQLIADIEAALADSFRRDYWATINSKTRGDLESMLRRSIAEGISIPDMAREIREHAPHYSRSRATTIARTESTRSINSGHLEGIRQLERESGVTIGKQWLSVQGATTRPEHAALDGYVVPLGMPFMLDGHGCRYPGDPNLPPEHVVNCMCGIISGTGLD